MVRSARTRILAAYIVLLAVSAAIAIFAVRQVLLIQLDNRVQNASQQEVLELNRLVAEGRDPETGELFTSPEALFDVYLARNVPSNEEALLTFVDGRFHRSALARYPVDRLPTGMLAEWTTLSSDAPAEGERVTGTFETRLGDASSALGGSSLATQQVPSSLRSFPPRNARTSVKWSGTAP